MLWPDFTSIMILLKDIKLILYLKYNPHLFSINFSYRQNHTFPEQMLNLYELSLTNNQQHSLFLHLTSLANTYGRTILYAILTM